MGEDGSSLSTTAIVGITGGATVAVLALLAGVVIVLRRRNRAEGPAYQAVTSLSDAEFDDSDLEADLDMA